MKWIDLMETIAAASTTFDDAPLPNLRDCLNINQLIAEHKREELATRESVDACIRMFSRNRIWPPIIKPNEKYFIQQRLAIAYLIASCLSCPEKGRNDQMLPQAPDTFGDEDQIEWLLIHGWAAAGWRMWLGNQQMRLAISHGAKPQ